MTVSRWGLTPAARLADAEAAGELPGVTPEAIRALRRPDAPRHRAAEVRAGRAIDAAARQPEVVPRRPVADDDPEAPRSTQELAPLVGISEAGLSKHLRQLAAAGLVVTKREGYYVLYSPVPERIDALSDGVHRFTDE